MPERVVDPFEAVDVDEQSRYSRTASARIENGAGQPVERERAVGERRERIMVRLHHQALLVTLAQCDIEDRRLQRRPSTPGDDLRLRGQPDDGTVQVDAAYFVLHGCMAALLRQLTASHDAREVALHIERFQRAELNYVGRFIVAENFGEAAVDEQRFAVPFDADAGQGGFDQRSEPLLADAEFLFGLFYGADIDLYGDEVGDFAVESLDRRNRRAAPVQRAVLSPIAEFAVPVLAAPDGRPQLTVVARGSAPRLEDAGRLAGDLVESVTGHSGEAGIDVLDAPGRVGDDDDRRTVVDRAPKPAKPDGRAFRFGTVSPRTRAD